MTFEDFQLPPGLLLGLHDMGFKNGPSDIQSLILPYSLAENSQRNLIVQSKTGTGKTVSYIIHVLARLQSSSQAVILLPTVELAFTVGSGIERMSRHLPNIQIAYAISSESLPATFDAPIIIGTIELWHSYQALIDYSRVQTFVVDEIDTMIIREDYRNNLLHLFENLSSKHACQILTYSSTVSEQIMNFTSELLPNSILIRQRSDRQQLNNIEQFFFRCSDEHQKVQIINTILEQFQQTQILIFCLNDHIAAHLFEEIASSNKTGMAMLTSDLNFQQRISLVEKFRLSTFRVLLISAQTNATLHGIDLDNVRLVINYSMPQSLAPESDLDYVTYHQRLDRCGRYDQHGYLFNLIQTPDDWNNQLAQTDYFSFVIKEIDLDRLRTLVL